MGGPKKGTKEMNPMEKFLGKGAAGSDSPPKAKKDSLVEDEAGSGATGKIQFSLPSGFKVPDGVKDGDPFDAMATLKLENGKLVLHELDGTPVDDGEDLKETDETEGADEAPEGEGEDSNPDASDGEDSGLGFLDSIEKKAGKQKYS